MNMLLTTLVQLLIASCALMACTYFSFIAYREILKIRRDITRIKNK